MSGTSIDTRCLICASVVDLEDRVVRDATHGWELKALYRDDSNGWRAILQRRRRRERKRSNQHIKAAEGINGAGSAE
jgi:hypothetical protein